MRRAAALILLLPACSMEPRYERPAPLVRPALPAVAETALPSLDWRDVFREAALQRVIGRALENGQDLRIALANVAIARGQYRVARAERLPELTTSASAAIVDRGGGGQSGISGGGGGGATRSYTAQGGLSSFEIDLFGRLKSQSDAALDEYLASEAGVHAARLALVAETASAWLTLATDRSLRAVAADTAVNARRSVTLTRARLTGGVAPRTDLRQAETILAQAEADLAALDAQIAQDRNALELLTGSPVPDADLPAGIEAVDGELAAPPAGLDSRILLRRPDVVQAEYALRAANARIGAARAAFFPTISLTAVAGFASTALNALFQRDSFAWNVAGNAGQSIFDWGGRRGDLAAARGRFDLALAQYAQAVQTAFREVADALATRAVIGRQFGATARLEGAAQDSFALAEARYRGGIDTYLTTLDAQRTLYSARQQLARARLTRADNIVELYRTLGGDALIDTLPRATGRKAARTRAPASATAIPAGHSDSAPGTDATMPASPPSRR